MLWSTEYVWASQNNAWWDIFQRTVFFFSFHSQPHATWLRYSPVRISWHSPRFLRRRAITMTGCSRQLGVINMSACMTQKSRLVLPTGMEMRSSVRFYDIAPWNMVLISYSFYHFVYLVIMLSLAALTRREVLCYNLALSLIALYCLHWLVGLKSGYRAIILQTWSFHALLCQTNRSCTSMQ